MNGFYGNQIGGLVHLTVPIETKLLESYKELVISIHYYYPHGNQSLNGSGQCREHSQENLCSQREGGQEVGRWVYLPGLPGAEPLEVV